MYGVITWKRKNHLSIRKHFLEDAKQGVTYVTLKNTSIEYESSTRSYSPNHSYSLKGYAGLEKMSFRVRASDVEKNIRQIISEDAPDILVIYYPNTKKLVQLQIELEDGSVLVLPKGEKRLERYVQ